VEPVARALRDSFTGYAHSAGLRKARGAVAGYATALGAPTQFENVLITSGASEAADLVLTALVNKGDEILLPAPGYPLYPAILNKLEGVARYYRLDSKRAWQPSIDDVESLVNQRTRALLLINPNNPAGSIIPDSTIKELLKLAARHELLVIADEVYRELCFSEPPTSASVLAQEVDVPLITLESLSKTHLVPGWRVGWMRYTHAELMRELTVAISRLASGRLCSPTPTQYAVQPALEGDKSFLAEFIAQIKRRRDFVVETVRSIEGLSSDVPAAAFYVMIKAENSPPMENSQRETSLQRATPRNWSDEQFVLELLGRTGVLVVPGSGFGCDPQEGLFRLVYLADEGTLGKVFEKIRKFVGGT
jgi:alanine-synthesizing transaminase